MDSVRPLGLAYSPAVPEAENSAYAAIVADVGFGAVRFRVGKLTPKKAGLFVTVWNRSADGSTKPLDADDGIDLLVVTVREGDRFGQFTFPKTVMVDHGIVSNVGHGGKRGFRVDFACIHRGPRLRTPRRHGRNAGSAPISSIWATIEALTCSGRGNYSTT